MPDTQEFDLLILGGGMSYVGAIRAAQLGMKVGLVERDRLGGTCLNRGCIPSKALLETADLLHRVSEQGAEFGLTGSDKVGLDYAALGRRRDAVVEKHVKGVEFLMKKNAITVLHGSGVLTGATSVHVSGGESGELDASADDLILATGSAPRTLPGMEIDGDRVITTDEALTRADVPRRVAIVGAGAVGVEWASLYRDFGADVHLVEFLDRIVPLEDPDVSKELARVFRKRGINQYTSSTIDPASIERTKRGVHFAIAARDESGRIGGRHRGGGSRGRAGGQGGGLPVPSARQGDHRRRDRRLRQAGGRCAERGAARRAPDRPARGRPAGRASVRPAGGGHRGRDRRIGPCPSDPHRSAGRGRPRGRWRRHPRLRGGTLANVKQATALGHRELGLSDEQVVAIYRQMLVARGVDERMWLMQRAGKIAFIISGQGHEGAQVAIAWPMRRNQDWMAPYYR